MAVSFAFNEYFFKRYLIKQATLEIVSAASNGGQEHLKPFCLLSIASG